jgi:hypothetical protein
MSIMRAQSPPASGDNTSLGDVARELRKKKPAGVSETAAAAMPPVQNSVEPEKAYRLEMSQYLANEDFRRLEKAADAARSQKSRFPGGIWKLSVFYEGVTEPPGGKAVGDAAWQAHIAILKRWGSAYPQSITARVALADAYYGYGWLARGSGFANTVGDDGWKLMNERVEIARRTLVDAASLKAKCPYWYEAMQHVALAQGWQKAKTRALFEQAVAFEPGYYQFYREYTNFLLPRWFGEDGEAEAFAEEVSNRVGGKEGAFLYFEIATVLNCLCKGEDHLTTMSWPKIKEGYAALEELYGASKLKKNRFAMMASKATDKPAAQLMFAQIGNDWDAGTWYKRSAFENAKAWAMQ